MTDWKTDGKTNRTEKNVKPENIYSIYTLYLLVISFGKKINGFENIDRDYEKTSFTRYKTCFAFDNSIGAKS